MKPPVFTTLADVGRRQRLGLTDLLLMYSIGANEHLPPDWGHDSIHFVISQINQHMSTCAVNAKFLSFAQHPCRPDLDTLHSATSMECRVPAADLWVLFDHFRTCPRLIATPATPHDLEDPRKPWRFTPCQVTQLGWRHHPKQRSWCRPPWLCKRSMVGDRANPWVQNLRTKTIQKRPEVQLV